MFLKDWQNLPDFMKCNEVRPYYEVLKRKKNQIFFKRIFDVVMAIIMILVLAVPMFFVATVIVIDSPGPVFFRQERITQYGRVFRIHKFRTMINNAEKIGTDLTTSDDSRITKVGLILRKLRIDEVPQLIDVLLGDMSFVGTRPEIPKYVRQYNKEMFATLLLPAGITSEASIKYKNEGMLLDGVENIDAVYMEKVLPEKMKWNLKYLKNFSFFGEIITIFRTFIAIF